MTAQSQITGTPVQHPVRFGDLPASPQPLAKPVLIDGRAWRSRWFMARDLGLPLSTLRTWLDTGADDRIRAAIAAADARKSTATHEAAA